MVDPDQAPPSQLFNFNGVDPDGNYLITPLSAEALLEAAQKEINEIDEIEQESLKNLSETKSGAHYGFDAPLYDPAEAGWGVIVHQNLSHQIQREIEKLTAHAAAIFRNGDRGDAEFGQSRP